MGCNEEFRTYLSQYPLRDLNEALNYFEKEFGRDLQYSRLVHRKKSAHIDFAIYKDWIEN